jgi:hypothetical protein
MFAEYLKETRRRYAELRSATVVMANVSCPRAVEMVQYLTAAKRMFVLWSGPDHGELRLPDWCQVRQWTPGADGHEVAARELSSMIGNRAVDIVVDCQARSETFAALSHLVERSGRGYLAITEASPSSEWEMLSAELCLDMATHVVGRRDVIMDDRHIWATWTRRFPRSDVPELAELRPDVLDRFVPQRVGS